MTMSTAPLGTNHAASTPDGADPITAQVIDLAGRQRMLNQRLMREVLEASTGIESDYELTIRLLRETADAFVHGGDAPLAAGARPTFVRVGRPRLAHREVFDRQALALRDMEAAARALAAAPAGSPDFRRRVQAVREVGGRVHAAADEATQKLAAAVQEQKDAVDQQLQGLLTAMATESDGLTRDAGAVQVNVQRVREATTSTSDAVLVLSAAAEQVSHNVQSMSAATEQLSASISEISRNSGRAAAATTATEAAVEQAKQRVAQLTESASNIERVLGLIATVARQTNLLALNAAIEAARAGEAGRGFAVVASEVKELARETSKATEEIGRSLDAIRHHSNGATKSVDDIHGAIRAVREMTSVIASAVQEQSTATAEIAHNTTEAAKGVGELSENLTRIATDAATGASAADEANTLAVTMSGATAQLRRMIATFQR